MKKHTMPVLSEQEREEDIARCLEDIALLEENLRLWGCDWKGLISSQIRRQKIALAALTAEPYAYADAKAIIRMTRGSSRFFTAFPEMSASKCIGLFIDPPVPVKQEGEQ